VALEDGNQCFCGNQITNGGSKVSESSCTILCADSTTSLCGGSFLENLYTYALPTTLQLVVYSHTVSFAGGDSFAVGALPAGASSPDLCSDPPPTPSLERENSLLLSL